MTATTKAPPTPEPGEQSELVHYSPEHVAEMRWLPFSARTLRDKAQAHQIPHSRSGPTSGKGGRIVFTLAQIREIAASLEVRPISETKPGRQAAA